MRTRLREWLRVFRCGWIGGGEVSLSKTMRHSANCSGSRIYGHDKKLMTDGADAIDALWDLLTANYIRLNPDMADCVPDWVTLALSEKRLEAVK